MAKPIKVEIELDEKGAVKSLTNFDEALARLPNTGKSARESLRALKEEQKQAADAADLLGTQLGVSLPREVRKFISETKLIGPALATAFNASIFLALGAALIEALSNMDKLTDKVYDWSGAMKEAQTQLEKTNLAIVDHNKKLLDLQRANALIGLTGVGRAQALAGFGQGNLAELKARLNVYLTAQQALNKVKLETITATNEAGGTTIIPTEAATQAINTLKNIDNLIATTRVQINVAEEAMKGLNLQIGQETVKAAEKFSTDAVARILDSFEKIKAGSLKIFGPATTMPGPTGGLAIPGFPPAIGRRSPLATNVASTIEEMNKLFGPAGETTTAIIEATQNSLNELSESHRKNYERMTDNIREGAGRVFDTVRLDGKNTFQDLAEMAKSFLAIPLRNIFQNAAVGLFGPLAAKGGIWGSIFNPSGSSVGTAAATGISGGIFGSLKTALFGGGGGIASQGTMASMLPSLSLSARTVPAALIPGIGGIATSGAGSAAGAGTAGLLGGMAALGPAAAIAGAAFATSMLIGWLAGRGARKRAEEAARRAAIQESYMFEMPSPRISSGVFGREGDFEVSRDLMGSIRGIIRPITIINEAGAFQMLDGSGADQVFDSFMVRVNSEILGGGGQLGDNIQWRAQQ